MVCFNGGKVIEIGPEKAKVCRYHWLGLGYGNGRRIRKIAKFGNGTFVFHRGRILRKIRKKMIHASDITKKVIIFVIAADVIRRSSSLDPIVTRSRVRMEEWHWLMHPDAIAIQSTLESSARSVQSALIIGRSRLCVFSYLGFLKNLQWKSGFEELSKNE